MTSKAIDHKPRQLTRRQRNLVEAYVANGGNLTKAAAVCGYAEGESGRTSAQRAMKTPHVQAALMQEMATTFSRYAPAALGAIGKLVQHGTSEYVRLEASKDLLDRAGFKPIDKSQMQVAGDIRVRIDLS